MKKAELVLVRVDPKRVDQNHPGDERLAREAAGHPPCWVILVGGSRDRRLKALRQTLGVDGIAKNGVNVYAPAEVSANDWSEADTEALPDRVAHYLADVGLRLVVRQAPAVEVVLSGDIAPPLLAAVVEAAAVYPRVDVRVGAAVLGSSLRWELRRDHFLSPPPGELSSDLNGDSPALRRVREQVERYAPLPFPVLVLGETGTGKEVVASMLHEQSARAGLFMPTNAAQLPVQLAESLLFGHVKGAFTGADASRPGRIREAEGGTFFLDEVFNLDPAVQGKLLRALNRVEEGIVLVEPLGSTRLEVVHTRLVVAALDDPRREPGVQGGARMREDLYYRVAAGVIRLPPLRECLDDLPLLCRRMLARLRPGVEVAPDGLAALQEHRWPGNVRELRLVLVRALVDGPPDADALSGASVRAALRTAAVPAHGTALPLPCDLATELKRIEVETMQAALRAAGGNNAEAGRKIGLGPRNARNFKRKLEDAEARLRETETADAE